MNTQQFQTSVPSTPPPAAAGHTARALTLTPSGLHSRTLVANLTNGDQLQITIGYTGESCGYNRAILDGQVIPAITEAVNTFAASRERIRVLEAVAQYALGYAQSDIDNDRESAQAIILRDMASEALAGGSL